MNKEFIISSMLAFSSMLVLCTIVFQKKNKRLKRVSYLKTLKKISLLKIQKYIREPLY